MKRLNSAITSLLATIIFLGATFIHSPITFAATKSGLQQNDYQNHAEKAKIEYVVKNKLMWLYPDGNFRPNQMITQADLVVGLSNVKALSAGAPVPELPANHWAKSYYERAKKDGILHNIQINPNQVLNREEASKIMVNAWESFRKTRTQKENGTLVTQPYSQISVSYQWLPKKSGKFINGASTSMYDAFSNVTRAELAYALSALHFDKVGITEGEKIATQIHNSLKMTNTTLSGKIPSAPGYSIRILVRYQKGNSSEYTSGSFSVNKSQIKYVQLSVKRKGEAVPLALYNYVKLPSSLERESVRW
ncbi:S-layer homology domain-containing protein [Brevibacillus porteri]|uniref:S-layer homology domain-containing protein n=1 Tax=Brevibacillus porteri TaxID=2126350 RepID=UPI003D202E09